MADQNVSHLWFWSVIFKVGDHHPRWWIALPYIYTHTHMISLLCTWVYFVWLVHLARRPKSTWALCPQPPSWVDHPLNQLRPYLQATTVIPCLMNPPCHPPPPESTVPSSIWARCATKVEILWPLIAIGGTPAPSLSLLHTIPVDSAVPHLRFQSAVHWTMISTGGATPPISTGTKIVDCPSENLRSVDQYKECELIGWIETLDVVFAIHWTCCCSVMYVSFAI
jgi:hypothetical protein